jgi:hypothetical protein
MIFDSNRNQFFFKFYQHILVSLLYIVELTSDLCLMNINYKTEYVIYESSMRNLEWHRVHNELGFSF